MHKKETDQEKYIIVLSIGNSLKALSSIEREKMNEFEFVQINSELNEDTIQCIQCIQSVAILLIVADMTQQDSQTANIIASVFEWLSSNEEHVSVFVIANENIHALRKENSVIENYPTCYLALDNKRESYFLNESLSYLKIINEMLAKPTLIYLNWCDIREFEIESSGKMNGILTECLEDMNEITNMMMAVQDKISMFYERKEEINTVIFFLSGGTNISIDIYEFIHFSISRFIKEGSIIRCALSVSEEEQKALKLFIMLG